MDRHRITIQLAAMEIDPMFSTEFIYRTTHFAPLQPPLLKFSGFAAVDPETFQSLSIVEHITIFTAVRCRLCKPICSRSERKSSVHKIKCACSSENGRKCNANCVLSLYFTCRYACACSCYLKFLISEMVDTGLLIFWAVCFRSDSVYTLAFPYENVVIADWHNDLFIAANDLIDVSLLLLLGVTATAFESGTA